MGTPANAFLLYTVKAFLHKNFVSKKNQELLIKGTKNFFELVKPKLAEDGNNKIEQFISFTIEKMEEKVAGTVKKAAGKKVDESSLM